MLILLHFWNYYVNKIYGKYLLVVTPPPTPHPYPTPLHPPTPPPNKSSQGVLALVADSSANQWAIHKFFTKL